MSVDHELARLADRQHGVVARRQLEALGLTPAMISRRLSARRLMTLHRGVYAVGHRRLTREGEWLAAVLVGGDGAALSHRSAAALHGQREERGRRTDVSTSANHAVTNWVELFARRKLTREDVTAVRQIPVTTIARTLVDLAELLDARQLARVVNEADVRGLLDLGAIDAALDRLRGRRGGGPGTMRRVLDEHCGPVLLRSELERRFRELLAASGLPPAAHNVPVGPWEVDALWPAAQLAVELDSRFHDTPAAQRKDDRKEAALRAAGWTVVRYRWRDVVGAPERTAAALRARLTG